MTTSPAPEALLDPRRGARLGAQVHLVRTRLLEMSCGLRATKPWQGGLSVRSELGFGWQRLEGAIGFAFPTTVEANATDDVDNVVWVCTATQELVYQVQGPEDFSDEEIAAFGATSGALTAYPYIRELVYSASVRSGLEPILLDLLRVPLAFEEVGSLDSRKEVVGVTDRRAGPKQGPYVAKEPRARNKDGTWRKKRSDAGKPRSAVRKAK